MIISLLLGSTAYCSQPAEQSKPAEKKKYTLSNRVVPKGWVLTNNKTLGAVIYGLEDSLEWTEVRMNGPLSDKQIGKMIRLIQKAKLKVEDRDKKTPFDYSFDRKDLPGEK